MLRWKNKDSRFASIFKLPVYIYGKPFRKFGIRIMYSHIQTLVCAIFDRPGPDAVEQISGPIFNLKIHQPYLKEYVIVDPKF